MTRDQLLSGLTKRLRRFVDAGEAEEVLDERAVVQARQLDEMAASADANGQLDVSAHSVLALFHWSRFQVLPKDADLTDLAAAMPHFRALARVPTEDIPVPLRAQVTAAQSMRAQFVLRAPDEAVRFLTEFEQTGSLEALNRAVDLFTWLTVLYEPRHPAIFNNLGTALMCRFEYAGDSDDQDAAITALEQAADIMSEEDPRRAGILANLGLALHTRFELIGQHSDLTAAIELITEAVHSFPPAAITDRAGALSNLGIALLTRSEQGGGHLSDLDAAIAAARQALADTPADYPGRARPLSVLGNALVYKFKLTTDGVDLDAGTAALQQAVDMTPSSHPDRPVLLMNLGSALRNKFELTDEITALDDAIDLYREAAGGATPGSRGDYLQNLGAALQLRFRRTRQRTDLDDAVRQTLQRTDIDAAVTILRQAVDAIPLSHRLRAERLTGLGGALLDRFDQEGDEADLDAAITANRQAVDACPDGHPARSRYLANLGLALRARSLLTGQMPDIDAAIAPRQEVLEAASADDPGRAVMLSDLAAVVLDRFERSGRPDDLDRAVDLLREAIEIARRDDPHRARCLSNLGNALRIRWALGGPQRDLYTAIEMLTEAVGATPIQHPDNGIYKSNLSAMLLDKFGRSQQRRDLDAAIELADEAAHHAAVGHSLRAMALNNLAIALQERFDRGKDPGDLDVTIRVLGEALDMIAPSRPERAGMLTNLALALEARFTLTGDPRDLDDAVETGRQGVAATPTDDTRRAISLSHLGRILLSRFEQVGEYNNRNDLMASVDCLREAANTASASWDTRIAAAWAWGAAAEQYLDRGLAVEGYSAAVALLPQVVWHSSDRGTQMEYLARWSRLATDAAACAIAAGEPRRAVEMLEQGRSVVWTQALRLRSDLSRLREQAPDLAGRLDQVRRVLDQPSASILTSQPIDAGAEGDAAARVPQDRAIEARRRLARAWDDLVGQVRQLRGFSHFLAPVPFADLRSAAGGGPVVVVNVSGQACHALIVTTVTDPGVQVIPLPGVTRANAMEQANELLKVLSRVSGTERSPLAIEADRKAVLEVLAWIWRAIAEPVLDALGYTNTPGDGSTWPRVWWCPTGPLTMLPLHAAGLYPPTAGLPQSFADTVPGRVISSYATTLGSLQRARRTPGVIQTELHQLVVGMPDTPGQSSLPAVPRELDVTAEYFPPPDRAVHLVGKQATRSAVVGALANYPWAHFACHAYQNQTEPWDSAFALYDGPVTVADLTTPRLDHAELAFLSACQTAAGSTWLPDEAIHLAAVLQLLGYPHVIATLWTISDAPAPAVARTVYQRLTAAGHPDSSLSAAAIHHAVTQLRDKYPANPLVWAPYIHFGP